jgi:hypothetical protein
VRRPLAKGASLLTGPVIMVTMNEICGDDASPVLATGAWHYGLVSRAAAAIDSR